MTTGEQIAGFSAAAVSPRLQKGGLFACPCCAKDSLAEAGAYEICGVCGWEDDPVQEAQPDYAGGANTPSLIQARDNYRLTGHSYPTAKRQRSMLP